MTLPQPILDLTAALSRLPGIGPRSAERIALHIVQTDPARIRTLAEALLQARQRIQLCPECGGLTEAIPCGLCADPRRDRALLCVVERPVDIISIEKAGAFGGLYHVLGGKLSPTSGVEPEDLRIDSLEQRLQRESVREVVLALGTDVEGDATGYYLAKRLGARGVKVTRIAHGLPAGSGLEFADQITLSRALEGRRELP